MIISHKHKFIFLKTKKTAGTSIEIVLSRLCGPDDVITPIAKLDEPLRRRGPQNWLDANSQKECERNSRFPWRLFRRRRPRRSDWLYFKHMPAVEVRAELGDSPVWKDYFKFAFDRNPWDRQVSAYYYFRTKPPYHASFGDFLRDEARARLNNYEIYSIDGKTCVDFLGRYESLDVDLRRALGEVGITLEQELPRAKSHFRPKGKHYHDYYDDETREIVRNWYEREIALLQYEF